MKIRDKMKNNQIAIASIWIASAVAVCFGGDSEIFIGATVATFLVGL